MMGNRGGVRAGRFKKNLLLAFTAQGLSFVFSCLMSLVVPKILGVEEYAYWQLFIFYSTYVGLFHFGLSDGVYLRYGGAELEEMDKSSIKGQFCLMVGWQLVFCLILLPALLIPATPERGFIWILTAIYLLVANATWFWGYVFQAANRTSVYSVATILSKVTYIAFLMVLLLIRPERFQPFIILYVIAQGVALSYALYKAKSFLRAKLPPFKAAVREVLTNTKIGIFLTISNIMSSLILGVGRKMIDRSDGIATFGLLSLSLSLTNFFLQFISQISMVLFPALRQVDEERSVLLFQKMRGYISLFVCGILVCYCPLRWILIRWLPQYEMSLYYMIFLLPICVFDAKMQLVYNTYFKVRRKERTLLAINVCAFCLSAVMCAISAFVLKSVTAVAVSMTLAIMFRGVVSDVVLSRLMSVKVDRNIAFEMAQTLAFVVVNLLLSPVLAFAVSLVLYGGYLMLNRGLPVNGIGYMSRKRNGGNVR